MSNDDIRVYEIIKNLMNKFTRPFDRTSIKEEILKATKSTCYSYLDEDETEDDVYVSLINSYLDVAIERRDQQAFDYFREVFYEDFVYLPGLGGYVGTLYALSLIGLHGLYELERTDYFEKKHQMKYKFVFHLYFKALLDSPLIIIGETGTGKELVGKVIHAISHRRMEPYQEINCAAIPEKMLESELFGYEKGAFTDATAQKVGLFELADGGIIFLDELGKMPKQVQGKLLKVLDEKKFLRLGGNKDISIDVRFIAAIQPNDKNKILEDLLYRLGYPDILTMPTLNESLEEIGELLIQKTLDRVLKTTIIKDAYFPVLPKEIVISDSLQDTLLICPKGLDRKSLHLLINRKYKGNYRELENILRGAIPSAYYAMRKYIAPEDLHFISDTTENIPKGRNKFSKPSPLNEAIKLKDIISYANNVRSSIIENKVLEVLRNNIDLKSAITAEGLSEKEYQNFWKKIIIITGKNIKELKKLALESNG